MRRRTSFRAAPYWCLILLTFAIAWRLRNDAWWSAAVLGTFVPVALSEGLARRHFHFQVFLQYRRQFVGAAVVVLVVAAALDLVVRSHQGTALFEHLGASLPAYLGLGFFAGFNLRRLGARAASPSLVEFEAGDAKATLYTLMSAAAILPIGSTLEEVAYLAGIALGVSLHAIEREVHYATARARKRDELLAFTHSLIGSELLALDALRAGRFKKARQRAGLLTTYNARMIEALAELLGGRVHKAIPVLKRALDLADSDEQRAKTWAVLALAHHDNGDEEAAMHAIARVQALDPTCPVSTVIAITLRDPASVTHDEAEAALLALLGAERQAAARAATFKGRVTDHLVSRAFGADCAFYRDALALSLLLLGNLRDAADVLDGVIRSNPRSAMARFHMGLLFEAQRARTNVGAEQAAFANVAIINYELAIRLSPQDSVTARRARVRIEGLMPPRKAAPQGPDVA